jgi:hypothetical protein
LYKFSSFLQNNYQSLTASNCRSRNSSWRNLLAVSLYVAEPSRWETSEYRHTSWNTAGYCCFNLIQNKTQIQRKQSNHKLGVSRMRQ